MTANVELLPSDRIQILEQRVADLEQSLTIARARATAAEQALARVVERERTIWRAWPARLPARRASEADVAGRRRPGPARLPADLERALHGIGRRERMPVRELLRVAGRELGAAYHSTRPTRSDHRTRSDSVASAPLVAHPSASPGRRQPDDDTLETVWTGHRDAPSLLGLRESKPS